MTFIIRGSFVALSCFHVVATLAYLLPFSPITQAVPRAATTYVNHVFPQKWNFFAPLPGIYTDKVYVACVRENVCPRWFDPSHGDIQRSYLTPFGPYGKLGYIHRTTASNLLDQAAEIQRMHCTEHHDFDASHPLCPEAQSLLMQSPSFATAVSYATAQCRRRGEKAPLQGVYFMALRKYPFPYSRRAERAEKKHYRMAALIFKAT